MNMKEMKSGSVSGGKTKKEFEHEDRKGSEGAHRSSVGVF